MDRWGVATRALRHHQWAKILPFMFCDTKRCLTFSHFSEFCSQMPQLCITSPDMKDPTQPMVLQTADLSRFNGKMKQRTLYLITWCDRIAR
jgi:hypothetical protein